MHTLMVFLTLSRVWVPKRAGTPVTLISLVSPLAKYAFLKIEHATWGIPSSPEPYRGFIAQGQGQLIRSLLYSDALGVILALWSTSRTGLENLCISS